MVSLSYGGDIMPQIIPIRDLKNTSEVSAMCHSATEPIFVTKNGYGDMVLMSMEMYEMKLKNAEIYRSIDISEQQIKEGKVKDARKSLMDIRNKYDL